MTKVEMFEELHNEKAEIVKQERVKVCDKIHHEVAIFLTRIGCNWKTNEDCGRWDGRITLINPHSDNEWDHANIEIRINDKYTEDYIHVDHRELTISATGWSSIKSSDVKVIEYYKTLAKVLESLNTLETALNEIDYTALEHAREEMYAVGRELEAEKKTVKEAEKIHAAFYIDMTKFDSSRVVTEYASLISEMRTELNTDFELFDSIAAMQRAASENSYS